MNTFIVRLTNNTGTVSVATESGSFTTLDAAIATGKKSGLGFSVWEVESNVIEWCRFSAHGKPA